LAELTPEYALIDQAIANQTTGGSFEKGMHPQKRWQLRPNLLVPLVEETAVMPVTI